MFPSWLVSAGLLRIHSRSNPLNLVTEVQGTMYGTAAVVTDPGTRTRAGPPLTQQLIGILSSDRHQGDFRVVISVCACVCTCVWVCVFHKAACGCITVTRTGGLGSVIKDAQTVDSTPMRFIAGDG